MSQGALGPFILYAVAVFVVSAAMIVASYLLGQKHRDCDTEETYESGVRSTGSARMRFDIKFYMIAMFFIIFDLESVFIFAWSVSLFETGWPGYIGMAVFISVLMAMLAYLWRTGALDWGPRKKDTAAFAERPSR
ncbi:MAG TPA: NADH-quinone oxidoreductase subunit A [Dissulfurispiraceae bacterium]|nr:NADH-quinone oxidoreductase subunit A [Dissulfurispiraceae bacterium]